MFLLRIFREKKAQPPPPRRKSNQVSSSAAHQTTVFQQEEKQKWDQSSLFSFSLVRDSPELTRTPSTSTPVRLIRLASFFALQHDAEHEVEFHECEYETFVEHVAKQTVAVSWSVSTEYPSHLFDLLKQHEKEREYLWIDPLCSLEHTHVVFARSGVTLPLGFDPIQNQFSPEYFTSVKTLVQRMCRSGGDQALRGVDFIPAVLMQAMSHCEAMDIATQVQAQWGVRTAKSMADLQLFSTAESPEETALQLMCEHVLERYPVLSLPNLSLVPFDHHVLRAVNLVLRLSALYEWFSHPDPADAMWNSISVPPHELKLTLMALIVQKLGHVLARFNNNDAYLDLVWEMEVCILSGGGGEEEESESSEKRESMQTFGQLVFGMWSLLVQHRTEEECTRDWLRAYLLCEQTRFAGDITALFPLFHLDCDRKMGWEALCRLAGVFQVGWLEELSHLTSKRVTFCATHNRVLVDLPSNDARNFGIESFRDEPAPMSVDLLFGEKPEVLLGFILSPTRVFTVTVAVGEDSFLRKLQANVQKVFQTAAQSKPYGLFVCVRMLNATVARCVLVRAVATTRKEWQIEAVCTFASRFTSGMDDILARFTSELERNDENLISSSGEEENFMQWPVREDGQRRTTFRPQNKTAAAVALVAVEDDTEKTTFDWQREKPKFDKCFHDLSASQDVNDAMARYHALLQRNYVHETQIAEHVEYFAQLCELLVQHLELKPSLLDDGDVSESLDFLCEDMKDALDLAREDGEDEQVLDFALMSYRKMQKALRATPQL